MCPFSTANESKLLRNAQIASNCASQFIYYSMDEQHIYRNAAFILFYIIARASRDGACEQSVKKIFGEQRSENEIKASARKNTWNKSQRGSSNRRSSKRSERKEKVKLKCYQRGPQNAFKPLR